MITDNIFKVTCDVRNCRNIAQYTLPAKGRMGHFYICGDCLETISKEVAAKRVPKSPTNAVKKALNRKSETIREMVDE